MVPGLRWFRRFAGVGLAPPVRLSPGGGGGRARRHRAGVAPLLIAGRDRTRADALLDTLGMPSGGGPAAAGAAVDLDDPESLARFAARCRLVVNCAGSAYRVLDTVAAAALRHGADYVDAAGDDPVGNRLDAAHWAGAGRVSVLSAGALPGLSGLLPRVLAADAARPVLLEAYLGGVAPLSPAAAGDVLLARGPEHGTPGASWQEGRVAERSSEPRRGVRAAAFPRPVDAFPFLSTEAVRLARATGVEQVRWYTVFGGERLAEELAMAWALESNGTADLAAAAEADARRHGAWYGQEFRLWDGSAAGPPAATLTLRAEDPCELSGFLTALAVLRTLDDSVPPGVHYAADVLDPPSALAALRGDPAAEVERH